MVPRLKGTGSVVVVRGLSCSVAGAIFPDQGSNPYLPRQQADSLPLSHEGSPEAVLNKHNHSLGFGQGATRT